MLVVLDVQKIYSKDLKQKVKSFFRPYKITKKIVSNGDISILNICYKQYRGGIKFNKIYDHTIGESKTILCSDDISLKATPFKRFDRNEFNIIMMENFVCDILKKCCDNSNDIKISFYDPEAEYPLFVEKLLKYTSNITVVSNMPRFYENESERLMNTIGASPIVSNSLERLSPCNILICPSKIKVRLPTNQDSLIFTSYKPLVSTKGIVITKYYPEFPVKYIEIKPDCTDELYFLSALYTLCDKVNLAKLQPVKCGNESFDFLKDDLIHYITANCNSPALSQ